MPCTRNPNGDRMEYTTADSFTRDTLLGARLRDSGTCISSVAWSDFHAPRTDAPVRFIPRTRHPALLAREGFNPGSFTIRWA